jgi:hypothetical protein
LSRDQKAFSFSITCCSSEGVSIAERWPDKKQEGLHNTARKCSRESIAWKPQARQKIHGAEAHVYCRSYDWVSEI